MNRLLYAILTVFLILFTACRESNRSRAQRLVDEFTTAYSGAGKQVKAMNKVRLDSARIEYANLSEAQEKLAHAQRLAKENQEILRALQEPQYSEVAYRILKQQLWDTGTAVERIQEELRREERAHKSRVPGWMCLHRFRVTEPDGYMRFYQYILYFDPALSRISGLIDLNDSIPLYKSLEDTPRK